MMKFVSKFARTVFRARTNRGYTQGEVAEAISVSVRWYQKIESGKRLPGAITLIRLILFLHIDLEEFRKEVGLVDPVRSRQRTSVLR